MPNTLAEAILGKPPPVRWRISAAWARTRIDCTLYGITRKGGCGAKCCTNNTKEPGKGYWPGRSGPDGVHCQHLGQKGCTLSDADKPVTCHLYPFKLKGKTIVLHGRALIGCCKPNHQRGPMIAEAVYPSFVELFGKDTADAILVSVKAGKDYTFTPPAHVVAALEREEAWAEANQVPELRSKYT